VEKKVTAAVSAAAGKLPHQVGDAAEKVASTVKLAVNTAVSVGMDLVGAVPVHKRPTMGSAVKTPYGIGVLTKVRDDGFALVQLDFGAKAFLDYRTITFAPVPKANEACSTVYGDGKVLEFREGDGFVVVALNFGAKAFLRSDQVRPARAYPFVPASYWTSGIFASTSAKTYADVANQKAVESKAPSSPEKKKGASPAKGSPKKEVAPGSPAKKAQEEPKPAAAPGSPAKKAQEEPKPADPSEEKDASEVPPPAQAEPPAAAEPVPAPTEAEAEPEADAAEGVAESAPASTSASTSSKKKKKKGKH